VEVAHMILHDFSTLCNPNLQQKLTARIGKLAQTVPTHKFSSNPIWLAGVAHQNHGYNIVALEAIKPKDLYPAHTKVVNHR
jgi:hypothetical protein